MKEVRLKRAYDPPAEDDGLRVLVDRLWPRGLRRTGAAIDRWLKEAAPSPALRRWFGHDPARWTAFRERYQAELAAHPGNLAALRELMQGSGRLTLLYAARDTGYNHAIVLRDVLIK